MSDNAVCRIIEKQEWMQPALDGSAQAIKNAFASAGSSGQLAKNALHGVWLGHPFHASITDVPIGSWTVAMTLDLIELRGEPSYRAGADFAVLLGLIGAVPSALSGATDWSDTHGGPQRIGAVHGILNAAAVAFYLASYSARRSKRRGVGRLLGFLGYGLVLASAYLGGELSHSKKIGVNHAPDPEGELPKDYTLAIAELALVEGLPQKVTIQGTDILLVKTGGHLFAMADKCSHMSGPLSEGSLEGDCIVCPWHQSRFRLENGQVEDGPATAAQPVLDVRVESGNVLVKRRG